MGRGLKSGLPFIFMVGDKQFINKPEATHLFEFIDI
jgi:hypothetical protein